MKELEKVEEIVFFDDELFNDYENTLLLSKEYLDELSFKLEKQNEINAFFEVEVLIGDQVNYKGIVTTEAENMTFSFEDVPYEDQWTETITELFELAKDQITMNNQAKSAVADLFMHDAVEEFVIRDNEVYATQFNEPYPARSAFAVKDIPAGGLVEIEVIASKSK